MISTFFGDLIWSPYLAPMAFAAVDGFQSMTPPGSCGVADTVWDPTIAPSRPVVANVPGEFYPAGADRDTMLDLLGRQVASPVQFVKGLQTLYDAGARVFVEVGPKKALHGFVEDVLGDHDDVVALFTNHPKNGDVPSVNSALCGLWAAGAGLQPREAVDAWRRLLGDDG